MLNLKNQTNGVTLIALIVTIIVLLILAVVSFRAIAGDDGIIAKAEYSRQQNRIASARELLELKMSEIRTKSYEENFKEPSFEYVIKQLGDASEKQFEIIEINEETAQLKSGVEFPASYEKVSEILVFSMQYKDVIFSIDKDLNISVNGIDNENANADSEETKLPENSEQNPQDAGVEVALKDGWGTQNVGYYKTSDGTEMTSIATVATVYAVSVGNGDTVPVPKGFYYVGGNLSTGVIISDNEADKYDGTTDKTTYAYTRNLVGNQFVWIPCTATEYKKCTSWNGQTQTNGTLANSNWDTTTPQSELTQIKKYGGFYVARYEAGLASDIEEFASTQQHTGSNQAYNKSGVPQSKAGIAPWVFVDWNNSKANAEKMYETDSVSSGLITGTQWDVILNKMVEKTDLTAADLTSSNKWGNYRNTELTYTGRLAKGYVSSGHWYLPAFPSTETTNGKTSIYNSDDSYGDLLTTGASAATEKYHIFDIAGNVWEWTEEASSYATTGQYRVVRGGSYVNAYGTLPACYRAGGRTVPSTDLDAGFRSTLYIK